MRRARTIAIPRSGNKLFPPKPSLGLAWKHARRYRRRRVAGVRSLPTKPGFRFSKPDPLDGAEFD